MQQQLFKIRDKRNKGWFFMDNEYLNGYAKIFGAIGTAIYVSLCRHADNETQKCYPSIELIAEELNISRPTVIKNLKEFEKWRLIEKIKGKRNIRQQWTNNEYLLLDKTEWAKLDSQVKQVYSDSQVKQVYSDSQVKQVSNPSKTDTLSQVKHVYTKDTHINNTHIKDTNIAKQSFADGNEINNIIELFKNINLSYKKFFSNNTQRGAIVRLLETMGRERIENAIKYAEITNKMPYAPTITTPLQLEDKIASLRSFIEKQKVALNSNKVVKIK